MRACRHDRVQEEVCQRIDQPDSDAAGTAPDTGCLALRKEAGGASSGPETSGSGTMIRMGLLCDYFVAPSDDAAAATIDRAGGPGRPAPPQPAPRRGLFRRQAEPVSAPADQPIYATLNGGGIEPVVQLGKLEELLTGRTFLEVLETSRVNKPLAMRDGGEVQVFKLSGALTNALAGASADDLARVAEPWAQIEEFGGWADAAVLADFLGRLAELARQSREQREGLYCWFSL